MKTTCRVWFTAAVFVTFTLPISEAAARLLCNADNVGTEQLQKTTMKAGVEALNGAIAFWTMLRWIEEGVFAQAFQPGEEASKKFVLAANLYEKAANTVDGTANRALANVDFKRVETLAQYSSRSRLVSKVNKAVYEQNGKSIFLYCSEKATELAKQTKKLTQSLKRSPKTLPNRSIYSLIREWNRFVTFGRYVSALFAVAGRER